MKIDISNGELLDKVTILQIKSEKITDNNKLKNVLTELNHLLPYKNDIVANYNISELYFSLLEINKKLWKIEDDIRDKERS
jgi:adenylate cyclase